MTIAVVPGPIFDLPFMSALERSALAWLLGNFLLDVEPSERQQVAQQRLLSNLFARATRIVALAGDVHFQLAARMTLWAETLFENELAGARSGALASSPAVRCRSGSAGSPGPTSSPNRASSNARSPATAQMLQPIDILGWNTPPATGDVTVGGEKEGFLFWRHYEPWRLAGTPALLNINPPLPSDARVQLPADFRYRVNYLEIDAGIPARHDLFASKSWTRPTAIPAGLRNAQALLAGGGGLPGGQANNLGRIHFARSRRGAVGGRGTPVAP